MDNRRVIAPEVISQALQEATPPDYPWASCSRVRIKCSSYQAVSLVEAARVMGLRGPSEPYLDPVSYHNQQDMIEVGDDERPQTIITFVVNPLHSGEPKIEQEQNPALTCRGHRQP